MLALLPAVGLLSSAVLAPPHRFASPVSIQVVALEVSRCSRPLQPPAPRGRKPRPASQPAAGRCLGLDLAVVHRDPQGRIQHRGVSYLLQQGFQERVALDFGDYAPLVLREMARAIEEAGLADRAGSEEQEPARRALEQIQRHVHYQLQPHVVLPLDIELAVARLADRFYGRARKPLVITSGPRTPDTQAAAMYLKLIQGASLRRLYRKTEAASEIRKAYDLARRGRKRHGAIIADMAAVIREQMSRGVYVSPHLKGGAVDIRSRNLRAVAKAALQRAVASFPGMRLIREEKVPPHFHLEINAE